MKRILIAATLIMFFAACDDDEPNVSIVGQWTGEKAGFKINPDGIIPAIAISEEELPVNLEFKSDGSVVLTDNQQHETTGTYVLNGNELTLNINYQIEFIALSGTYDVETLTSNSLVIAIEREGSYDDPGSGQTIDGTIEAVLSFSR